MPSTSAKQAKFMRAVANSPKFAKKVGVSQSVGKDFEMADKKRKKFSEGGRAERMRDRRMADIESDYKKALARGKSEKEARAKRAQREADARDDYAKRTGADRTETRAAEKAAEARLTATRRGVDKDIKPLSVTAEGSKPLATAKVDVPKVETPKVEAPKTASTPAPIRRTAPKPKPKPKPTPTPTPSYTANFGRPEPKPEVKPKPESVGKQIMRTSAQRQQGQLSQLGREIGSFFSPLLKNKYSDKAKGGKVKGYAKGGKIDGIAIRGKTRLKRKK